MNKKKLFFIIQILFVFFPVIAEDEQEQEILAAFLKTPSFVNLTKDTSLVFKLNENWMILKGEVNGKSGNFIFDTGANYTVLASEFIKKNAWDNKVISPKIINVKVMKLNKFKIDQKLEVNDIYVGVISMQHLSDLTNCSVDGIIGVNLMKTTPFTIKYNDKKIIFHSKNNKENRTPIDLRFENNRIFVTLKINGKKVEFNIDSGATSTSILKKDYTGKSKKIGRKMVVDINGINREVDHIVAIPKSIFIGKYKINLKTIYVRYVDDTEWGGAKGEPVNLLGISFLKLFDLTIDLSNNKLYLTPVVEKPNARPVR